MTVDDFIEGIPVALTPQAVSRALEAVALRDPDWVRTMPDELRPVWTDAAGRARAVAKASVDLSIPGQARDSAWAAIGLASETAGALAVRDRVDPQVFPRLYAPWAFMTGDSA